MYRWMGGGWEGGGGGLRMGGGGGGLNAVQIGSFTDAISRRKKMFSSVS